MSERVVIRSTNSTDRWQWVCPNGHRSWEPTNGGIWCKYCSQNHAIDDPHHHELVNRTTEETVPWDEIEYR